jgi:cytoskeletal protein CcmA (bactofilin family)
LEVCNIAQGTTIEGTVKVDSNIRLEGLIQGAVTCGGRLVMSSTAKIIGDVICKNIISEGIVEGNIVAKEKIHLMPTSIVLGNIKYKSLQIDLGAVLNGQAICSASEVSFSKEEV